MKNCKLCQAYLNEKDRIFMENEDAFAITAKWPQREGHSMVLPKRHVENFADLSTEEAQSLLILVEEAVKRIDSRLNKSTVTLLNSESRRTQEHLHFQLVPLEKEIGIRDLIKGQTDIEKYPQVSDQELVKMAEKLK
jgi:diadenosine tetraphosphate (Ap4A) HIT family hydrolase